MLDGLLHSLIYDNLWDLTDNYLMTYKNSLMIDNLEGLTDI